MKGYIEERAIEIARYIIDNNTDGKTGSKVFWDFKVDSAQGRIKTDNSVGDRISRNLVSLLIFS